MKFSTKSRYGLRVMMDLAQCGSQDFVALKDLAASREISVKYLEQIMAQLCKAGFVHSVRGPAGGYKLAREPKDYTAGEIIRLFEGKLAPINCLEDDRNLCPRLGECTVVHFWEGLYSAVNDYVNSVTLADLVGKKA